MKKSLIISSLIALGSFGAAQAQVGTDTPPPVNVTPPPIVNDPTPPPPAPVPAQAVAPAVAPSPAPAVQQTTTTTAVTTTAAPVYTADPVSQTRLNRLRIGAYLAPNMSWMRPTAATDDRNEFRVERDGSRVGFTYGLMGEYFFAENYGLVTGLQVNQTGGSVITTRVNPNPGPGNVMIADFDYRLQYLEIPIALKLRTDDINGFRFFGQLGASLGINIGKKVDYKVTYTPDPATGSATEEASGEKIKLTGSGINVVAPVMFQMNIGAGLEYPISNKLSFYTGLFFNNGFAPDATNPEKYDNNRLGYKGSFRDGNVRLNNFALRVGLFF